MSEKPLLLSSARSGVLIEKPRRWPAWRIIATIAGITVVVVGTADLVSRAGNLIDGGIARTAFAPVGTLDLSGEVPSGIATTSPITPAYIRIPSLQVNADIVGVGLKSDGKTMAAPSDFNDVAWYQHGAKPGGEGSAVFAGHLNSPILLKSGVFEHLKDIKGGDDIFLEDTNGSELRYRVSSIEEYTTELAPVEDIFRVTGPSQIVLVTCEGEWDAARRTFEKRLVVVAELLSS